MMIVAQTSKGYYEVLEAGPYDIKVNPLYKASNGFIAINKWALLPRSLVKNFFNYNPPLLRVNSASQITEQVLSFAERKYSFSVSRHSNGIYEYNIYAPSMIYAKLFEQNELKAHLWSFDGQVNWRILYKDNWYEPNRVWKEGLYAPPRRRRN